MNRKKWWRVHLLDAANDELVFLGEYQGRDQDEVARQVGREHPQHLGAEIRIELAPLNPGTIEGLVPPRDRMVDIARGVVQRDSKKRRDEPIRPSLQRWAWRMAGKLRRLISPDDPPVDCRIRRPRPLTLTARLSDC